MNQINFFFTGANKPNNIHIIKDTKKTANDRIEIVNPENDLAPEQILKSHIRHISDIGEFFSKVKVSYVISTTYETHHHFHILFVDGLANMP